MFKPYMIYRPLKKCSFSQLKRLTIEDLNNSERRTNGIIPIREYIKWLNKPQVMVRDNFFNKRSVEESITDYEPHFTTSMAKWLWTTYTLNDYPYFDLNIVTVFTNLKQCLQMCQHTMTLFHEQLNEDQFQRINYFMVPLYQMESSQERRSLIKGIPGKTQIVNDINVSPFQVLGIESSNINQTPFWVQDPVYIVLFDDIIKNLAHDKIRLNQDGQWEQGYLKFNSSGHYFKKTFSDNMDSQCGQTVRMLNDIIDSEAVAMREHYIPSQLVQLFEVISGLTPEYRILAVDSQQYQCQYNSNWWYRTFFSQDKNNNHKRRSGFPYWWPITHEDSDFYTGSSVLLNNTKTPPIWDHSEYHPFPELTKYNDMVTFAPNFKQIQKICLNFNPNLNAVKLQSLAKFINKWYGKSVNHSTKLKHSQLRLIHSHLV